jgi:hypothetical protein
MPCPFYPLWLDHCNYTWWRVQVRKLLIMQFSLASCCLICLRFKYCPQNSVIKRLVFFP